MIKKLTVIFWVLSVMLPLSAQTPRGNDLVLVYPSQYVEFDPHKASSDTEAQLFTALYEGLVSYDPQTLRPAPGAAESWIISEDRLTYTFTLRKNLYFSDGSRITAQSFYRAFLRLLTNDTRHFSASFFDVVKGARAYRLREAAADDLGLKVIDDRTLQITLGNPAPYFLSVLAHYALSPISQRQLPMLWDSPLRIACSGPYMIAGVSDKEIMLEKNPFYWDAANVAIGRIYIRFSDDAQNVSADFNRYRVDWASSGTFAPDHILAKESLRVGAQFATSYYFFASDDAVFTSAPLRIALVQAMPLTLLRKSQLISARTLVPPIKSYPKPRGIRESFIRAERALADLGYAGGENLPPVTIAAFTRNDAYALLVKEAWENLGLQVSIITPQQGEDYFDFIQRVRPTLALMVWIGDYLDPQAFLNMWRTDSPYNFSNFKEKAFDNFLDAANFQSGSQRLKTLSDAEALLLNGGSVIPLGHPPSINLIDTNIVSGWYDNPLDIHHFKYLTLNSTTAIPAINILLPESRRQEAAEQQT
jgi:oligopeptide transport system substrate-binding protein